MLLKLPSRPAVARGSARRRGDACIIPGSVTMSPPWRGELLRSTGAKGWPLAMLPLPESMRSSLDGDTSTFRDTDAAAKGGTERALARSPLNRRRRPAKLRTLDVVGGGSRCATPAKARCVGQLSKAFPHTGRLARTGGCWGPAQFLLEAVYSRHSAEDA